MCRCVSAHAHTRDINNVSLTRLSYSSLSHLRTAFVLSQYHPRAPIIAVTRDERTARLVTIEVVLLEWHSNSTSTRTVYGEIFVSGNFRKIVPKLGKQIFAVFFFF